MIDDMDGLVVTEYVSGETSQEGANSSLSKAVDYDEEDAEAERLLSVHMRRQHRRGHAAASARVHEGVGDDPRGGQTPLELERDLRYADNAADSIAQYLACRARTDAHAHRRAEVWRARRQCVRAHGGLLPPDMQGWSTSCEITSHLKQPQCK